MKIVDHILKSGPVKWILLYIALISAISFFLASFRPASITDNLNSRPDSSSHSNKTGNIKNSSLLAGKRHKEKNSPGKNKLIGDTVETPVNFIKKYMDKYQAINFNECHYPYTIDYQENLKNKNAIFYVVVNDIFEENGKLYMKAYKSYLGLNVYLKIECNKLLTKKLKDTQYYTYVIAKINKVNSIYFTTKGTFSPNRNSDGTDVDINLASNNINLMITGKCLDMFEK